MRRRWRDKLQTGTDRSDNGVTHAFDSQVDYLWQWIYSKHPTASQRREAVGFFGFADGADRRRESSAIAIDRD